MRKYLTYAFILIILSAVIGLCLEYSVIYILNKQLNQIKNENDFLKYIENVLPDEANKKVLFQENNKLDGKVITASFKIKNTQDPKKIIKNYLIWGSKAINNKQLDIDSIRIFVYFNKDKERYYAVLGRNKMFLTKKDDFLKLMEKECVNADIKKIKEFCIVSDNLLY